MDEITACAFNAVELDKSYGDEPVQVRVTMGKEPRHFLAIFKGRLIIYEVGSLNPQSPMQGFFGVGRSSSSLC